MQINKVKPARHSFRIGTKLEAVDRQNPELICVSTVSALRDDRFLVHFDGWDESFDYWCDETCPYIHHVGWCEENHKALIPPNGINNVLHLSYALLSSVF